MCNLAVYCYLLRPQNLSRDPLYAQLQRELRALVNCKNTVICNHYDAEVGYATLSVELLIHEDEISKNEGCHAVFYFCKS